MPHIDGGLHEDFDGAFVRLRASDAEGLRTELVERGCDFLVAGAYSHSRAGEFCFGGVTRDLLLNPEYCVLISH